MSIIGRLTRTGSKLTIRNKYSLLFIFFTGFLYNSGILTAQPRIIVDPGEFYFTMPAGISESSVMNIANDGDSTLLIEIQQDRPIPDIQINILAWTRYTDKNWEFPNLITSLSSLGRNYHLTEYDGIDPLEFSEQLDNAHVLLIPDQENGSPQALAQYGSDFQESLHYFVEEQGGIIVALGTEGQTAAFLGGADLMSIEILEVFHRLDCTMLAMHPVSIEVPSYTALQDCNLHSSPEEDVVHLSISQDREGYNISARKIGNGGLVYIGMDWWQFNSQMTRILLNSVMWDRGASTWLGFEAIPDSIPANDSFDLFFTVYSDFTPEPGEYEKTITIISNDTSASEVNIPVGLLVTPWRPSYLQLDPPQVFYLDSDEPENIDVVRLRNRGEGFFQGDITLEDEDQEWLIIDRRELLINPGLTDRILLQFNAENTDFDFSQNTVFIHYNNPDPEVIELPILYYTGLEFGAIRGRITDATSDEPISDATVNVQGLRTSTLEDGSYNLPRIPPGNYLLTVTHPDYLPVYNPNLTVLTDSSISFDESLNYCCFESDLGDEVNLRLAPNAEAVVHGNIMNSGSGTLEFTSSFTGETDTPNYHSWQLLKTITTDSIKISDGINGAIFAGDYLYLALTTQQNLANRILVLNREGVQISSYEQPSEYVLGIADLAWDGQFLYGTDWGEIVVFNTEGEIDHTIHAPFLYNRALAWDPDHARLWVADARSEIVSINEEGERQESLENPGLSIYGLAWYPGDPLEKNLYLFSRDGPNNTRISRMSPSTGETEYLLDIPSDEQERAAGIHVSTDWSRDYWSLIVQMSGGRNDTKIYSLDKRPDWVSLSPEFGTIRPHSVLPIRLYFTSVGMSVNEERTGYFLFQGLQRGGTDTIRVNMSVLPNSIDDEKGNELLPDHIDLVSYPNPFNGSVIFEFNVPSGKNYNLSIFDLQGRLIKDLSDGVGTGASVHLPYNSEGLSSGLYLVRLKTAEESRLQRLVLMR